METTLSNQMLMCTSLCILIASFFRFFVWWRSSAIASTGKLPPGPRGWPLVGNIFDLGTSPHSNLAALKEKYGPLIWIRLGSVNTLVVSSADAAMELFKNHDHSFCNRHMNETMRSDDRLSSTVALSQYNGYWRMMRRLYTTELIAKKRIQDTSPLRRKCVDKMISWIAEVDGTCVELTPFVLATLFNLIGNLVLSKDLMDPKSTKKSEFFVLNAELAQLIIMPNVANFIPSLSWIDPQGVKRKVQEKLNQILRFVGGFVEERRREMKLNQQQNKEKDFLDVLLEFEGNGKDEPDKISDRNLNILILELLTAGRRICPGLPLAHKMLHLVLGSLLQSFEWTLDVGVTPDSIDMGEKLGAVLKKTIPLRAIPRAFV
ncbi:hypothetical protein MKW98_031464 [Papaver atlanticum]|uniref:Cytochrome P450 n=1 Tax=Papaver atlanticum TaxID=357466 RepID=A0AAD4X869_9MAGN|nr:hypothetical protein MKW98_031464 [Papaver atlanticum]